MSREIILEALNGIRDEFITEAGARLGLLTAGAAAGAAGAAAGGADPATLYTLSGTETAAKTGFGAWVAKGGWIALTAGVLVAAGIAVGAFLMGHGDQTPPAGSDTTAQQTTDSPSLDSEPETETETEPETEAETHPCANGHTLDAWHTNREPTCYREGESEAYCTVCGERITNPIARTPHDFSEGYCSVCGLVEGADEGFVYEFETDRSGTRYGILAARDGAAGEKIILPNVVYDPESDGMVKVGKIGQNLFREDTTLREVVIPDTVTVIDTAAFSGCSAMPAVTIPDSVTEIGMQAFADCSSLTEFTIPPSVRSVGGSALFGCMSLEKITLARLNKQIIFLNLFGIYRYVTPGYVNVNPEYMPTTLKTVVITEGDPIPGGSFRGCTEITDVIISDEVTEIGGEAFMGCTSLKRVHLPENLTALNRNVFDYCTSLTEITIPEGVTAVEEYAFRWCTGLTELYVPDSVRSFDSEALYHCDNLSWLSVPDADRWKISTMTGWGAVECPVRTLIIRGGTTLETEEIKCVYHKQIYLPATLTRIEDKACWSSLVTDIYFAGTEEQWNAIEMGEGNENLTKPTIHFGVSP